MVHCNIVFNLSLGAKAKKAGHGLAFFTVHNEPE
jgi:hypothetical protein